MKELYKFYLSTALYITISEAQDGSRLLLLKRDDDPAILHEATLEPDQALSVIKILLARDPRLAKAGDDDIIKIVIAAIEYAKT